jgi:hypothetical protein
MKYEANELLPHRYIDHAIDLEDNAKPPFSSLYRISESKLKYLKF